MSTEIPSLSKRKPTKQEPIKLSKLDQEEIIKNSGILKSIPTSSSQQGRDVLFESSLLVVPLMTLYISLDYLVHAQYDLLNDWNSKRFMHRFIPVFLVLCFLVYMTTLYKFNAFTQGFFSIGGIVSGCLLIQISEANETFGYMSQTPGLATLWVYCCIQMHLSLALIMLGINALFYYRESLTGLLFPKLSL